MVVALQMVARPNPLASTIEVRKRAMSASGVARFVLAAAKDKIKTQSHERHLMKRPTKRRTAAGRLAWLDAYVATDLPVELHQAHMVDVGFGTHPTTCIETLIALKSWEVSMTAVDVDASIVGSAQELLNTERWPVSFRVGDFRLDRCVHPETQVRLVRCANVLRGYREDEVKPAWQAMASVLVDGGILLDATCDAQGAVGACVVLRKQGIVLHREALVFYTDFSRGFAPRMFRDVLPRIYRRRAKPGSALADFLDEWQRIIDSLWGEEVRSVFERSASMLPELHFVTEGLACWRPAGGLPLPKQT